MVGSAAQAIDLRCQGLRSLGSHQRRQEEDHVSVAQCSRLFSLYHLPGLEGRGCAKGQVWDNFREFHPREDHQGCHIHLTLVPERCRGLLQIALCRGGVITSPLPESAALHGLLTSSCSYRGHMSDDGDYFSKTPYRSSWLPDIAPQMRCLQGLNLWPLHGNGDVNQTSWKPCGKACRKALCTKMSVLVSSGSPSPT